ncbi:unnamed protein product [Scytosiphon promiscuus]
MSAMCTPRARRTPLRPVTPMGVDLPEDTPSKIRARNAMECASIRRKQREEAARAELETGLDLHHQMKEERARKAATAKADAELRRELTARQTAHKHSVLQEEVGRRKRLCVRGGYRGRADDALKELKRLELETEKQEGRQTRAERMLHSKQAKQSEQARELQAVKKDYEDGLKERRRKEEEAKAAKKAEVEARKAAILEARDLKIKERALAASMLRAEIEQAREEAKAREEEAKGAAEENRRELRARANRYREDKELAKTSAFSR